MESDSKKIKIAISGGIGFGSKLTVNQLITISKYMNEEEELELTTFQQLYNDKRINTHSFKTGD